MAELNVLQELTKALIAEQARQEQIKPLPKQSPYKETKRGTNTLLD
jgi:hypothetical protein